VTGGIFGGRTLRVPAGRGVRPTTDRVREATFARLGALGGARVLDLYAGTGALGIEALSRGAVSVVFVERASASLDALRRNLATLCLGESVRIVARDVAAAVADLGRARERFDLVLLDPPYETGEDERTLRAVVAARILAPGALLVVERSRRHALPPISGLALQDERRYGDTIVSRLAVADDGELSGGKDDR
jgi:16S rRNA (guanine(966)-N(2))-methyltransferase RsmD